MVVSYVIPLAIMAVAYARVCLRLWSGIPTDEAHRPALGGRSAGQSKQIMNKVRLALTMSLPFVDFKPSYYCKGQNQSKYWYTSQGLSRALKSQILPNLTCSKYIYRSKWVDRFWLVKAFSGVVQGGQNDSKNQSKFPLFGSTVKTGSWLVLTSTATFS